MLLLQFAFLIVLLSSCANQSHPDYHTKEIQDSDNPQSIESEIDTTLRLKFTTGVRAILEDSKGNFWFGSHQEGVALFDGEKLTYFTVDDGLSHNQIRTILEDSNGIVWFEGGKGISSYNGKKITTHTEKDYSSKNEWQKGLNDLWFKGDEEMGVNEKEGQFGVYRYDGSKLSYLTFPIEPRDGSLLDFHSSC